MTNTNVNGGDSFINCSWKRSSGWMNRWYGLMDTVGLCEWHSNIRERAVSRALCSVSGPARPWKHENDLLYQRYPQRIYCRRTCIFRLEVPRHQTIHGFWRQFANLALVFPVPLARMDLRWEFPVSMRRYLLRFTPC